MDSNKIFVYGSLRDGFYNYNKYLFDNVLQKDYGMTKGRLYHLKNKGYPALIEGENSILGEIFTLRDNSEDVIKELDKLENYFGENNCDNEYHKVVRTVLNMKTDQYEQLPMYIYNMDSIFVNLDTMVEIPSGDWKEYMLEYSLL